MSSLLHLLCLILGIASLLPVKVDADDTEVTVYVQDSQNNGPWGLFSTHFIGARLPLVDNPRVGKKWALIHFVAGDWADGSYVLSPSNRIQSPELFEFRMFLAYGAAGTYWVYCAITGTTDNYDYLQIRIVNNDFQGPITPKFDNPPWGWRYGWPPYGVPDVAPFTSGTDATGSDGAVATLPNPTLTVIPSHRSSTSTSTSVWLAPLLVGIIMIAIFVPIVIITYKKGKQNSKQTQVQLQVESTEAAIEMKEQQQQQIHQENRIQV